MEQRSFCPRRIRGCATLHSLHPVTARGRHCNRMPNWISLKNRTRKRNWSDGILVSVKILAVERGTYRILCFLIFSTREYRLHFYHTHTNERLDIIYRRGQRYLPEALASLDHYLRDHRTGEVRHFDPHLFDLLYDLTASLNDSRGEIDVVCGYRTPWSNEFLRTRSAHTGVALHSLHMQAEAIDIRLPGISTAAVRDAALRLHRGGVGYNRNSNFVHVDVGRVRRW